MIELVFQFNVVVNTIGYIGDDGRRGLIVKHVVDDGLHIDFTGLLLCRSLLLLTQQSHVDERRHVGDVDHAVTVGIKIGGHDGCGLLDTQQHIDARVLFARL